MNNFAVCILSYKREIDLKKTLKSFDKIGFESKNIFIFDDRSLFEDENSLKYFSKYNYIVNKINLGLSGNIANIIKIKNFDYILLFEDHDLIHPSFFNHISTIFKNNQDLAFVVTERIYIDHNDKILKKSIPEYKEGIHEGNNYIISELSKFNFSHPLCVTINTRKLNLVNFFNLKSFWFYGDIYLWLSLAKNNKIFFSNKHLYYSRLREEDHTLNSLDKFIKTIYEVDKIHKYFIGENKEFNKITIKIKFLIKKYLKLLHIVAYFKIKEKKNIKKKFTFEVNFIIFFINLIPFQFLELIKKIKKNEK